MFCGAAWAVKAARRLSLQEASRLVDTRIGTKELFLTVAQSEHTGFWPVVDAQAEEQAQKIKAKQVVPFHWHRGTGILLGVLALVCLAEGFLPRLDPFGKAQQRAKQAQQQQRLVEMKKTTEIRAEQIARSRETESRLEKALVALEKTFKEAKPKERELNLEKLAVHQKEFGEMWRQKSLELPRDTFERAAQSFSRADTRQSEQWKEQLKKGDFSGLNKEIAEAREQLKKLAALPESAEKRALQEIQMGKQLAGKGELDGQSLQSKGMARGVRKTTQRRRDSNRRNDTGPRF